MPRTSGSELDVVTPLSAAQGARSGSPGEEGQEGEEVVDE